MNTLLDQLIALTCRLALAADVPVSMLAELRRYLAAMLIQQNPGFLPVIPKAGVGAEISDAAVAGAEFADKLNTEGIRLRLTRQPYLAQETAEDLPSQIFGPFVDDDLSLVQFSFFETARFVSVVFDLDILFVGGHETVMLLPVGAIIDAADPRRFDIPAGTVWLKSDRLAANAPDFATCTIRLPQSISFFSTRSIPSRVPVSFLLN